MVRNLPDGLVGLHNAHVAYRSMQRAAICSSMSGVTAVAATADHQVACLVIIIALPEGDVQSSLSGRDRGPLREDEARRFLQQLVIGLDYCHRMGVVNRQALNQLQWLLACLQTSHSVAEHLTITPQESSAPVFTFRALPKLV